MLALAVAVGLAATTMRGRRGDLPRWLLQAAGSTLPPGRAQWGRAMLAELDQRPSGAGRWRFSLGCSWAVAIDQLRRPLGRGEPGLAPRAAIASGIAASIGSLGYALLAYPGLRGGAASWGVVAFALAVLGGYGCLALLLSRGSAGQAAAARRLGLATGLVTGGSWFAVWQSISFVPIFAALLTPVAAAVYLAWSRRSLAAGVWAGLWAGLTGGLVFFIGVSVASYLSDGRPYDRYVIAEYQRSGAANIATYAVGDNLSGAVVMLLVVPVFACAFGSLGAWLATRPARST